MAMPKWNKKDLEFMDKEGYKIIPCDSENEAYDTKYSLRRDGKCAQAGRIINREGKEIFFVCTKERVKRNGGKEQ